MKYRYRYQYNFWLIRLPECSPPSYPEQEFKLFKHNYLFSQRKVEFLEDFATDIRKLQVQQLLQNTNINQNLTSNNSQGISGWMTVIKPVMWIPVGCYADPDPGSASASVRSRIQKRIPSQGVKSCLKVIFFKYKYNLEISDLLKFSALFCRYSAIFNLLNPDPHHCITTELQEIKNVWRWNKIIEKHKKHCLSIL